MYHTDNRIFAVVGTEKLFQSKTSYNSDTFSSNVLKLAFMPSLKPQASFSDIANVWINVAQQVHYVFVLLQLFIFEFLCVMYGMSEYLLRLTLEKSVS